MTQYQQLKNVLSWLADSYRWNITPEQLTEFLNEGIYGNLASVNDYEAFAEEYDLEALAEFWDEGIGWTFADLAGLVNQAPT